MSRRRHHTQILLGRALDLLLNHDLKVHGEILLRVHHNLLIAPGITGEIVQVRSHHQALAQCEGFLNRNGYTAVPRRVAAVDRPHATDITCVVPVVRRAIHEHQIPIDVAGVTGSSVC